jgi:hypothetical protein
LGDMRSIPAPSTPSRPVISTSSGGHGISSRGSPCSWPSMPISSRPPPDRNGRSSCAGNFAADWDNVSVTTWAGLTVAFCRQHDADVIIRGARSRPDLRHEYQLAAMNEALGITTLLLPAARAGSPVIDGDARARQLTCRLARVSLWRARRIGNGPALLTKQVTGRSNWQRAQLTCHGTYTAKWPGSVVDQRPRPSNLSLVTSPR